MAIALVGAVLLATGLIKANDPSPLASHIFKLRIVPRVLINAVVGIFIVLECLLGTGLLLGIYLRWLVPVAIAILAVLTTLTAWATGTGRVTDCGCYNGLLDLTPQQSMLLNGGFISLLTGSLWLATPTTEPGPVVIIAVALSAIIAAGLPLYYLLRREPLFDLSPLKVGRPWNPKWLGDEPIEFGADAQIVYFANPYCSLCKTWTKVLQAVHLRPDLPGVLGIRNEADSASFSDALVSPFPVVTVRPIVWVRLVSFTPSAIVVDGGVIRERWSRHMPRDFVERIKNAPESVPSE